MKYSYQKQRRRWVQVAKKYLICWRNKSLGENSQLDSNAIRRPKMSLFLIRCRIFLPTDVFVTSRCVRLTTATNWTQEKTRILLLQLSIFGETNKVSTMLRNFAFGNRIIKFPLNKLRLEKLYGVCDFRWKTNWKTFFSLLVCSKNKSTLFQKKKHFQF